MDKTGQRETQCRGPVTAGDGDNEGAGPRQRSVNSGRLDRKGASSQQGRWQVAGQSHAYFIFRIFRRLHLPMTGRSLPAH